MKTRADYAQKGEKNKYAFKIIKIIFTILTVKEICFWKSWELPVGPQGFMKEFEYQSLSWWVYFDKRRMYKRMRNWNRIKICLFC
jgi:hypothetical protein